MPKSFLGDGFSTFLEQMCLFLNESNKFAVLWLNMPFYGFVSRMPHFWIDIEYGKTSKSPNSTMVSDDMPTYFPIV